ncbi:TAXI family TRAP transporter solute-binding subunit [Halomonas heilongjiangensis]|uniref:C4-dicarboxylate ABC transporter substrate-binding protein n=1 Tax=Halomonas heilongjiangensis TaxID=1387883 RepID=A0A2N7TLW2_9GAMM|nr:TAXI family TRAP transporter solute-binding subunit [Halomonas heilongjiangensis]PMR69170.1 C4-dicarboxylate ABC transporter substrate-binding protein [Halomonas heilongjiangensis]PXX94196.1 C4-dicarboxylate ABC transporter substrate-binding protein [Halomonas heilongjiangensis]
MSAGRFPTLCPLVTACALLVGSVATLADDRAGWPEEVLLGTASLGGTYQVYGDGLVTRLIDELGVEAVSQATGGPYHNMTLVHTGVADLGLVTLGPARELWDGEAEFAPGEEMRDVRALFPMYQTPFHVVTLAGSGVESIADLSGKRVGVGPMGGTCAAYWPQFLEALGVEDVHLQYAGANHLTDYLTSRLSDAFAFCAGLPIGAFERLERRREVHMFGLTEQQQATLLESFPVSPFEIPADVYASMDAPHASVAFWNFAIGHKDLPESFVYEVMKLVLDHPEAMEAIHPAAAETRAEHLDKNSVIWFHPGAVRYYEEQGLEVPTAMLPPEMRPDEEAEDAADVAADDASDETPSDTAD